MDLRLVVGQLVEVLPSALHYKIISINNYASTKIVKDAMIIANCLLQWRKHHPRRLRIGGGAEV